MKKQIYGRQDAVVAEKISTKKTNQAPIVLRDARKILKKGGLT